MTPANYKKAANDLTPDMSRSKGKPPRTQFWASDLSVIHEQFHFSERKGFAATGVANAQTWLNGQTATAVSDVQNLLTQVPGKVIAASEAAMTMPGKEERAYTAGAPLYATRATAITANGDAGKYAAPAPPPGSAPSPGPAPVPTPTK